MPNLLSQDEFTAALRSALNHLYEPNELRRSPLGKIFGIEKLTDNTAALRKILQNAILSLKPDPQTPAVSNTYRVFEVLYYRYIEQSTLKEVAAELALSIRQVHRIETMGLEALSDHLRARYQLVFASNTDESSPDEILVEASELDWLQKSNKSEDINLADIIDSVTETISPLMQDKRIQVDYQCEKSQTWVRADPTILRQAVVSAFIAAIQFDSGGEFCASVMLAADGISFSLSVETQHQEKNLERDRKIHELLDLINQLIEITGGKAETRFHAGKSFQVSLKFPSRDLTPVMVVDDNADVLLLMERYLTGTVYQFTGVREPQMVVSRFQENHPKVLILDVMLPGMDGWQLLRDLKTAGLLEATQVIVSTILPQETIALAFGANGFLRKPVTREKLLMTLDHLSFPAEKEPPSVLQD